MKLVHIIEKDDDNNIIKENYVNVYEAEKIEDVQALIEHIESFISWRFTHDYDDDGKRFNHYYANYPISFDIETSSFYNTPDGKFITNDDFAALIETKKQKEYEKQLEKLHDKRRATNKATVFEVREKEKYLKCACMYVWQMAFGTDDTVIIGRTWNVWIDFMQALKEHFNLSDRRSFAIYVHNLRYEWSFIKNNFTWKHNNTFLSDKVVYYASTDSCYYGNPSMNRGFGLNNFEGFTFRDSLILSGVKLENLHEIMNVYQDNCYKLKGYDYDKVRHSETPLNNFELAYCICDVLSLNWYIREKMEERENRDDKGPNICKIAITQTSEVRRVCRDRLFYKSQMFKTPKDSRYVKYHKYLENMKFEYEVYQQIKRAFQGGFTHANRIHCGQVFINQIMSCDIKSSYPAVMVMSKEFPRGPYKKVEVHTKEAFREYITTKSCLFDVTLFDVRPKQTIDPSKAGCADVDIDFDYIDQIISTYKVEDFGRLYPQCAPIYPPDGEMLESKKWYKNNGRLRYADRISLTINQIDWKAICRFYDFDVNRVLVSNFRIAEKGYLPKPLIEYVLELFRLKSNNKKGSLLYNMSKRRLNSLFGMIATDILKENFYLNGTNRLKRAHDGLDEDEVNEALEQELEEQASFLCYQWSTILTSEARWAVFRIISEGSKYNHVYTDTDSEKFIYNEDTLRWIQIYNDEVDKKIEDCLKYYEIPKYGIDGLGHFELENDGKPYKKFVTCGAKRYLYEDEEGHHITCAGLKKDAIDYLVKTYGDDLYSVFGKGTIKVDKNNSGRLIATYVEGESIIGQVIDYLGNAYQFSEVGYCHLEKTTFDMKLCDDYERMEDLFCYQTLEGAGGL